MLRHVLVFTTVALARLGAQEAPVVRLQSPDTEFPEPLTSVSGLRELSDGRVIVVDGQERRVLLLDLARGTARPIGREGAGPGEYAVPRRLWALRGDTSLLHDPGNGRYLVLLPNGETGPTFTLSEGQLSRVTALRGVDGAGRFYAQVRAPGTADTAGADAAEELLVRLNRETGRVDTLARIALPAGRMEGSMSLGGGMIRRLTNRPLAAEDVVAVAHDGRVAVVRVADYHVDWISGPDRTTKGPPVSYEPIPVTEAEKRAALEALVVPGQIITRVNPGARAMPLPRGSGTQRNRPLPPGFDEASMRWPEAMPPFLAGAASVAPDGRLWVLRSRSHRDSIPAYDVFDATGRRTLRATLPPRTQLAGFGRGAVYLTRRDADDLLYLQRYRVTR